MNSIGTNVPNTCPELIFNFVPVTKISSLVARRQTGTEAKRSSAKPNGAKFTPAGSANKARVAGARPG